MNVEYTTKRKSAASHEQTKRVVSPEEAVAGLREAFQVRSEERGKGVKERAIRDALNLCDALRGQYTTIQFIGFVPRYQEGDDEHSFYAAIKVVCPKTDDPDSELFFLSTNSNALANSMYDGDRQKVGELITANADIRSEEDHQAHFRLAKEVESSIDRALNRPRAKDEHTKLVQKKYRYIRRFLELSDQLPKRYPEQKFFQVKKTGDGKKQLVMWYLTEEYFIRRLLDKTIPSQFASKLGGPLTTEIDVVYLQRQYEICQTQEGTPEEQDAAQVYRTLFLKERDRVSKDGFRNIAKAFVGSSPVEPRDPDSSGEMLSVAKEASPVVDVFVSPVSDISDHSDAYLKSTTHKQKRLAHKGQPQAKHSTQRLTSLAELGQIADGDFVATVANVAREETVSTKQDLFSGEILQSLLEAAETDRDTLRPEVTYNRFVDGINLVDQQLAPLKRQEQAYHDSQKKDSEREAEIRGLQSQIKELNSLKKSLMVICLQKALETKTTYPFLPPLVIIDANGSIDQQVHLFLHSVKESNVGGRPYGIKQPAVETKFHLKKVDPKRRGNEVDLSLAVLIEQIKESQQHLTSVTHGRSESQSERQRRLAEFEALSLDEKLEQVYQDRGKSLNGEIHPALCLAEEVLTIRAALNESSERERLKIKLFAIGPTDERGRLVIEDPAISQYTVYLTYPHNGRTRYMDSHRIGIAYDAHDASIYPRENLQYWDTLVNSQAEILEEWVVPAYNRQILELNQIMQVAKRGFYSREITPESLRQKKLAVLASYFSKADELISYYPQLSEIYHWVAAEENVHLTLFPVKDHAIRSILCQQAEESVLERKKKAFELSLTYDELWQEFNASPEGREAVTKIYDVLGIELGEEDVASMTVFENEE